MALWQAAQDLDPEVRPLAGAMEDLAVPARLRAMLAAELRGKHTAQAGLAAIEALLRKQRAVLLSHPNWIIDVRDNDGGADGSYAPLLPWRTVVLQDERGKRRRVGLVFGGVEVNVVGEELDRRLQLAATRRRPFAEGLHAQVGGLASRPLEEVANFGSVIGRLLCREPDGSAHAGMINEECGATAVATIANIHSINDSRAISNERGWPRFVVLTVVISPRIDDS